MFRINLLAGVVVSRWMPQSSTLVAGCAEQAAVGSTPIHSRQIQLLIISYQFRTGSPLGTAVGVIPSISSTIGSVSVSKNEIRY